MASKEIHIEPFDESKVEVHGITLNSTCLVTGGEHQVGYVKNCVDFPRDHPEFLHCLSCGATRCVKCGETILNS